jgi:RNA polymerase sigma factor (sigma-70 family)
VTPRIPESAEPEPLPASPEDRARLLEGLFREHNQALVSFLTARLNSEAEARDVAQEAYVRLLQLDKPTAGQFLRAYLFRIASNIALDRLRQRSMRVRLSARELFDDLRHAPPPELQAAAQQEIAGIRSALRELPEKASQAFVLHIFANQSIEDIAQQMRLTTRMVRYHIARALEHCRARLTQEDKS